MATINEIINDIKAVRKAAGFDLPSEITNLRTGTALDGRMLIACGPRGSQRRWEVLQDVRARLPRGWTAEVYEATGLDLAITHR